MNKNFVVGEDLKDKLKKKQSAKDKQLLCDSENI